MAARLSLVAWLHRCGSCGSVGLAPNRTAPAGLAAGPPSGRQASEGASFAQLKLACLADNAASAYCELGIWAGAQVSARCWPYASVNRPFVPKSPRSSGTSMLERRHPGTALHYSRPPRPLAHRTLRPMTVTPVRCRCSIPRAIRRVASRFSSQPRHARSCGRRSSVQASSPSPQGTSALSLELSAQYRWRFPR